MKKSYKIFLIVLLILSLISLVLILIKEATKKEQEPMAPSPDALINEEPYSEEETKRVIDFLENGTGIVVFKFINCKWCQRALPIFKVAIEETGYNSENVLYYNPYYIRKDNTEEYRKIVEILNDYLSEDDEGNKRLYVPEIVFLKDGKIVAHKSDLLEDYTDVEQELTLQQQDKLKNIYKEYINLINN